MEKNSKKRVKEVEREGESGGRYRKAKKEYRRLCEEKKEEKNKRWLN